MQERGWKMKSKQQSINKFDDKTMQKEYAWECNECGAQEYKMGVSEDDVHILGCSRCGCNEWHKAEAK